MPCSGTIRRAALVRTDVSLDRMASIIPVTRFGELGTTLVVIRSVFQLLFVATLTGRGCI
jgi:hypothetical protein